MYASGQLKLMTQSFSYFTMFQCTLISKQTVGDLSDFLTGIQGPIFVFRGLLHFFVDLWRSKICVTSHKDGPIGQNLVIANLFYIVSWSSSLVIGSSRTTKSSLRETSTSVEPRMMLFDIYQTNLSSMLP
jgi:hypothetical protein